MISDDWKERIGYRLGHVGADVGSGKKGRGARHLLSKRRGPFIGGWSDIVAQAGTSFR